MLRTGQTHPSRKTPMVVDKDAGKYVASHRRRHRTVVGIFVVVGLALILLHNAGDYYGLRFHVFLSTPTSADSKKEMISRNESGTECHNERKFSTADNTRFALLELERQRCLDDIRSRMMDDYRPFFEKVSKVALVDVALHTNLGDTILWRAALHLATMFSHSVHYVCSEAQHHGVHATFPRCDIEKLIQLVKDNGLVMYHPGGNWGTLYRDVQEYRLGVLERLGEAYKKENGTFKVIQLPQSIAYAPDNMAAITRDDALINGLPSGMFALLTRQDDSLEWAREHYNKHNINILASPDMAFALGELQPNGKPVIDVAFIMRGDKEDKEQSEMLEKRVTERFEGTGLTYSFQDWGYSDPSGAYAEEHPTLLSEVRLNAAIRLVSRGKVLVTNRFHGHVVGMMLGRTTFWIDTIQGKLKHSRAVAFNSSTHCTDEAMRSFGFKSTMDALDAAIAYLGSHHRDIQL